MAAYRPVWLEIAEDQYRRLADELRPLVDGRLGQLLEDPFDDPGTVYNRQSDQYSVPLDDRGFLFFAVVADPPIVIILRLVLT